MEVSVPQRQTDRPTLFALLFSHHHPTPPQPDASAQALAANCPNLTAVRFGHTAISDVGVAAIAKACPVAEFDLNLCQNITNLGVQAIAEDCPDVTNIRLHSTKVTDIGIQAIASKCPKLASIRLGNTQITGGSGLILRTADPHHAVPRCFPGLLLLQYAPP